jgi:uncharacterized protein YdhG (YjbR/CyaY superfamily)
MKKTSPKTVADYIDGADAGAKKKLREMRACIRKAAPDAEESLKWGLPAFSSRRILVMYAAHKHHIGFYPTSSAIKAFAKELSRFKTARGSIQFPLEKSLPLALVRKIVEFRVRESLEKDTKWRTGR